MVGKRNNPRAITRREALGGKTTSKRVSSRRENPGFTPTALSNGQRTKPHLGRSQKEAKGETNYIALGSPPPPTPTPALCAARRGVVKTNDESDVHLPQPQKSSVTYFILIFIKFYKLYICFLCLFTVFFFFSVTKGVQNTIKNFRPTCAGLWRQDARRTNSGS
jgi:hypothetical protein